MAYPDNKLEDPSTISLLFQKRDLNELVEVFPAGEDMERLRLHYVAADEEQKKDTAASEEITDSTIVELDEIIPPPDPIRGETIDAVGLYLKEMARVPLLNYSEEVSLAENIEKAEKAKVKLAKLNGSTPEKEKFRLSIIIENGKDSREHLIKANTRLVVSIAKKYLGRGVPFLDLIQEGNLGLMKAVNKYDHRRGFRFSTYATWWIRQTITRSIADQGRTIRVPVHMIDRIRLLYKTARNMEQILGRPPKVEELAEKLDTDVKKVQWMLQVSWLPLSLESPVGDDEDSELGMFVEDEKTPTPSEATYHNLLGDQVEEVLASLSPREARILRLRFGLENGRSYTLEEVGEKFGLTRERIRQIEGKALRRLRHPMRSRQLRQYL